jgi:hypothetical protein
MTPPTDGSESPAAGRLRPPGLGLLLAADI